MVCFECKIQIFECMGFVVAGDILQVMAGEIEFKDVRQRCAKCVEKKCFESTKQEFRDVA
jgi:hypothetical protein